VWVEKSIGLVSTLNKNIFFPTGSEQQQQNRRQGCCWFGERQATDCDCVCESFGEPKCPECDVHKGCVKARQGQQPAVQQGERSREQGAGNRVQEAGRKRSEQDDDKGHCSCRSRWAAGCAARARETATGALPANAGRRKFLAHQNRTAATTTTRRTNVREAEGYTLQANTHHVYAAHKRNPYNSRI